MSTIDTSTFNGDHKFKCFSAPLGSRGRKDFLVHSVKLCILLAQAQAGHRISFRLVFWSVWEIETG